MFPARSKSEPIQIDLDGRRFVHGDLAVPADPHGLVIFAHGSGSSRHSARNQAVARALNEYGLATLLMDLLTTTEEVEDRATGHLRFDVRLLASRLSAAIRWRARRADVGSLPLGLFGASTGAAAALIAAAEEPELIDAVVSRGGRPDLAGPALEKVRAPTLLIVGGWDDVVIELNEQALARLTAARETQLVIVPGASHLFEEPGKMAEVSRLAGAWFQRHLAGRASVSEQK
jgi:dienelactone hydrolase